MKARLAHLFVFAGAHVIFMVTTRGNRGTFAVIFYQAVTLLCSYILLDLDYDVKLLSREAAPEGRGLGKQILRGCGYGVFFAVCVFVSAFFFADSVTLIPAYIFELDARTVFRHLSMQLLIAFSEEALFRYYLHEALRKLKLPDWLWAALISLLFGALHLYNYQIVAQFWIATVFSLYVFGLKLSRRRETYCTLAVTHYVYNLCWFYLFGMAV